MLNRPVNGTETGEIVASTRDYESAQKTVSKLIAGEVPARDIAIVGQSVRTVERVTGKPEWTPIPDTVAISRSVVCLAAFMFTVSNLSRFCHGLDFRRAIPDLERCGKPDLKT